MSDPKAPSHVCVLCNAKLESKEALQEHFRKHANREIDGKGRPRKPKTPGGANYGPKKSVASIQRVIPVQPPASTADVPAAAPCNSSSSSTNKNPVSINTSTSGIAKSPGKSTGIVCDVCGQEFETVTIAIQHKFKKHPDSAIKHFCPHCGQQFPLKINRDKHLQAHPSTPPSQLFPCQECGVVFYNAQAQNYHFKSTHKRIVAIFKPVETPPPSKKIRVNNAGEAQSVYYCHICGYEYIIKFNLQKHIERHHPEKERNAIPEGIIKCTTCDALFYSKKAYDNHNMYHRPDDLYVTSEEQRLQTVSRVDQDFDIRRVQPGPDKFIPVNRPRPSRVINLSMGKMDSKRRLSSKQKRRRVNSQKARPRSRDDSSDETEESVTSSESELSPDSGPDSDSDSDVPLKSSVDKCKSGVTTQPGNSADDKTSNPVVGESKEDSKSQVRVKKKIKTETGVEIKMEPGVKIKTVPGVKIKTEPGVKITTEPGVKITMEPGVKITTEPGVNITTEPGVKITTEPGVKITTEPGVKITTEPGVKIKEEPVEESEAVSEEMKEEGADTLLRCSKRVENNRQRKRKLNGGKGGEEEVSHLRMSATVKEEVPEDVSEPTLADSRKGKQKLTSETTKTDSSSCLPSGGDVRSAEKLHQETKVGTEMKVEDKEDSSVCDSEVPANKIITGVELQKDIKKESS